MSFEEITDGSAKAAKLLIPKDDRAPSSYTGPRRFSYSASQMLQSCERKYFLKYVLDMPKDSDVEEDANALIWGKAYHWALETAQHARDNYRAESLLTHCKEQGLEQADFFRIAASVNAYFNLREKSYLHCIACEIEIGDENFVGYIDLILGDASGFWWITDMKTSSIISDNTFSKLTEDSQLNTYANFAQQVATKLGLKIENFAGVRYNVVSKTRTTPKPGETIAAFIGRTNVECHEAVIPVAALKPVETYEKILRLKKRSDEMKVHMDITKTEQNRGNCLQWSRMCEWASQCSFSGMTATESLQNIKVFTGTSMIDQTLPAIVKDDTDLLF